jgi:hypothetical protein
MSLLNDLRDIADRVDPSVLPQSNEVGKLLGALIYRVEHGETSLAELAEKDAQQVSDLFSGHVGNAEPVDPATIPTPGVPFTPPVGTPAPAYVKPGEDTPVEKPKREADLSEAELDRRIAELEQLRSSREATASATTVDHNAPFVGYAATGSDNTPVS